MLKFWLGESLARHLRPGIVTVIGNRCRKRAFPKQLKRNPSAARREQNSSGQAKPGALFPMMSRTGTASEVPNSS
jgi:hypothetical protein